MATPICLIKGKEIEDPKEDLRAAVRVEQYRVGKAALYLPQGLRWAYVPLREITRAEQSHRIISGGHCVTVREEKPAVDISFGGETLTLNLEKPASMQSILDAIHGRE